MSDQQRVGGCACGAVRFAARDEPYRVGVCHCTICRKWHGAPFNAFVIFPADAVTVQGGETVVYASSEAGRRHSCRTCGSPVFTHELGSDEIELPLGAFDVIGAWAPTYEVWIAGREPWLPTFPGVRHYYDGSRPGPGRTES